MAFIGNETNQSRTLITGNYSQGQCGGKVSCSSWGHFPRSLEDLYFSLFFLILLSTIIIFGNILVIASYKFNAQLQNGTSRFLISLAISDLLVGAISVPMWIFVRSTVKQEPVLKYFFYSLDVFSACASIMHLTAVSLERYNATSSPFKHNRFSTTTQVCMICAAWAYAILLASLFPVQSVYQWSREYTVLVMTTSYIFPLITISVVYYTVFKNSKLPSVLKEIVSHDIARRRLSLERERKVAVTAALITFLFLFAWSPFFVVTAMAQFCGTRCLPAQRTLNWLVEFVKWMHYSNSGVNPFVYGFRSKEMRKTFRNILRKVADLFCRKNKVSSKSWTELWLKVYRKSLRCTNVPTEFVKWMHYSNSGVNPFIYGFWSKEMRKTFRSVLKKAANLFCRKNKVSPKSWTELWLKVYRKSLRKYKQTYPTSFHSDRQYDCNCRISYRKSLGASSFILIITKYD